MRTVTLLPYGIEHFTTRDKLIVRYRVYEEGRWRKNGFWLFLMPCHECDLMERAYIEFEADSVHLQHNMLLKTDDGMFFS